MTSISLRKQATSADLDAIRAINEAAFDRHGRTAAFDSFRAERNDIISLVAVANEADNSRVVGHILFSPVRLEGPDKTLQGMGLGQLAILPEYQRQGIGKLLATTGLEQLQNAGCPFVIVVGHASYYPRFGFEAGKQHGVKCQWNGIPDDSFMIRILDPKLTSFAGTAYFDGL